jgi:hypothetical protein
LVDTALKRQQLVVEQRAAAADQDHRNGVEICVCHTGDGIGDTRSRRYHRDTRTSGRARPTVRHMRGGLLVTRIDDPQTVLEAGLEDGVEMSSVKGENIVDTLAFERSNQHLTTVYAWHRNSPASKWGIARKS